MSDRSARRLIVGGPRDGEWFQHPAAPDGQVYSDGVLWMLEPSSKAGRLDAMRIGIANPANKVDYYAKTWWNPVHRVTLPLWVRRGVTPAQVAISVERAALLALGATRH